MHCRNCGSFVPDSVKFCPVCGGRIEYGGAEPNKYVSALTKCFSSGIWSAICVFLIASAAISFLGFFRNTNGAYTLFGVAKLTCLILASIGACQLASSAKNGFFKSHSFSLLNSYVVFSLVISYIFAIVCSIVYLVLLVGMQGYAFLNFFEQYMPNSIYDGISTSLLLAVITAVMMLAAAFSVFLIIALHKLANRIGCLKRFADVGALQIKPCKFIKAILIVLGALELLTGIVSFAESFGGSVEQLVSSLTIFFDAAFLIICAVFIGQVSDALSSCAVMTESFSRYSSPQSGSSFPSYIPQNEEQSASSEEATAESPEQSDPEPAEPESDFTSDIVKH